MNPQIILTPEEIAQLRLWIAGNIIEDAIDFLLKKLRQTNFHNQILGIAQRYNGYQEAQIGGFGNIEDRNKVIHYLLQLISYVERSQKVPADASEFAESYNKDPAQGSLDEAIGKLDGLPNTDQNRASVSEAINLLKENLNSEQIHGTIKVGETNYVIKRGAIKQEKYSVIFEAEQQTQTQNKTNKVLIRILRPQFYDDQSIKDIFVNGIIFQQKLTSLPNSSNILKVIDGPLTDDKNKIVFAVLQYMEGGMTLFDYVQKQKFDKHYLSNNIRDIFGQLCNAVKCIHFNNSAHRGIRPSSVYLNDRGEVYLTNFDSVYVAEQPYNETQITKFLEEPYSAKWLTDHRRWRDSKAEDRLQLAQKGDIYSLCAMLVYSIKKQKLATNKIIEQIDDNKGWDFIVKKLSCTRKLRNFLSKNLNNNRKKACGDIGKFKEELDKKLEKSRIIDTSKRQKYGFIGLGLTCLLLSGLLIWQIFSKNSLEDNIVQISLNAKQLEEDYKQMYLWDYAGPSNPDFLTVFPFLKEGSEFRKKVDSLMSALNKTSTDESLVREFVTQDPNYARGKNMYSFKEIKYAPGTTWMLNRGEILTTDTILRKLKLESQSSKPLYGRAVSVLNRIITLHDTIKRANPAFDSSYLNQLLSINSEKATNVVACLIFLACHTNSDEVMLRYPVYTPFDSTRMRSYRFYDRPWWKYVKKEYPLESLQGQEIKLTRPYLDIRKGMPPVRTFYQDIKIDEITFILGIDLVLNPRANASK